LADGFFFPFYAATNHLQKRIVYRPFDKMLALMLSEMVDCQTVSGVNYTVKPAPALTRAWGFLIVQINRRFQKLLMPLTLKRCKRLSFWSINSLSPILLCHIRIPMG
jgi:hypothetical protein